MKTIMWIIILIDENLTIINKVTIGHNCLFLVAVLYHKIHIHRMLTPTDKQSTISSLIRS